jgi:uncharacterized protein YbjT (DUF2867 family)
MTASRILILGGAGFIGQHVAARLCARNRRVIVPTRRLERARHLLPLPTIEVRQADPHDDAQLEALLTGCDAVINLVGILHGRWGSPYGPEFAKAHVTLPRRLAAACVRLGIRRLVHVSALGVPGEDREGASMYLRSKADGERAIRSTEGLDWTILRPSVVFGPGDQFLNLFARLQRLAPLMPLARATARFQPVYVGDVADAIVNALDQPATFGRTYELAGPEVFTLAELVRLAGRWGGRERPIWALPYTLGQLQAGVLGALPNPLMSSDNFDSMAVDNVATGPIAPELGIVPTPLGAIGPLYLGRRAKFSDERTHAHR